LRKPNPNREDANMTPQHRAKRILTLCAVFLVLGISLWCARKRLHSHYIQQKGSFQATVAQTLSHTRFVQSRRAHSYLSNFADLNRYQAKNQTLPSDTTSRVVFYGDSITDFWPTTYAPQFFPGKPYIGRGITGQSTDELLWRFQQDVLDLHPSTVVILAGTNDVVLPERHITYRDTITNIQTMVQLATQHRIRVILCSLPPVSRYPQPQQSIFSRKIKALNTWLQTYAAQQHLTYVDYYAAMADPSGAMNNSLTVDGLHPSAAGYAVMRSLAQQAIDNH
jgi:lysophospholipase L1-like esterase